MAEVAMSMDHTFDKAWAILYSPPKHGKTFMAGTISEHWPEKLPAAEMTSLDDMLWFLFDRGGLDGFRENNLSAPFINLAEASGKKLQFELKQALGLAKERVEAGITKTIVVDTLTGYDDMLVAFWQDVYAEAGGKGWEMYGKIKTDHMDFARKLKALSCNVLILCHPKVAVDVGDNTSKMAKSMPGFSDVAPQLTGKSLQHYMGASSLILPLLAEKKNGKVVRNVYPNGSKGWSGGNRFQQSLGDVEPADFQALVNKIRKHNA